MQNITFSELLTLVMLILKSLGHLDISWWLVFLPALAVAIIRSLAATLEKD